MFKSKRMISLVISGIFFAQILTSTLFTSFSLVKVQAASTLEEEKLESNLKGDVNGDGIRNSIDFARMKMYLLGMITSFPVRNSTWASDVSCDGVFNSIDFAYMKQFLLGMRELPDEPFISPTPSVIQTLSPTPSVIQTPSPPQTDTHQPSKPEGLTCLSVADATVSIYWEPPADGNIIDYMVIKNGRFETMSNGKTECTITGLTPNETYKFNVMAIDTSENMSEPSDSCLVTTKVSDMEQLKMSLIRNFNVKGTTFSLTYDGDVTDIQSKISRALSDAIYESNKPFLITDYSIEFSGYAEELKLTFSFLYDNTHQFIGVARSFDEFETSLLNGFDNRLQNIDVIYKGTIDDGDINKSLNSILSNDTYLLANIREYNYQIEKSNGFTIISFDIDYKMTKEQEYNLGRSIDFIVSKLTSSDMSDHEKEKLIHDYILSNIEYTDDVMYSNAYSALFFGKTNCEGYAMLTHKMLKAAGIENIIVTNEDHAWNIVKINNNWYHLDTTWNDGPRRYLGFYKYYNLTDNEICQSRNYVNRYGILCTSDYIEELIETNTSNRGKYSEVLNDIKDTQDYVSVNNFQNDAALSLFYNEALVKEGENLNLVDPKIPYELNGNSYEWSTSDSDVATVTNGVLTAKKEGTVFVSAKTIEGMFFTPGILCKVCVLPVESEGEKSSQYLAKENMVGFSDPSVQPQITINNCVDDINATTTVTNASDKIDEKMEFLGEPIEISTTSEFNWAEIGFKLSKEQLETVDINNLVIYWYDEKSNEFVPQATRIDEESGVISTTVTHFSTYFVSFRIQGGKIDIAFVIDSIYSDQASLNTFKYNIIKTITELCKKSNLWITFIDSKTKEQVHSFYIQIPFSLSNTISIISYNVGIAFEKVKPGGKVPNDQELLTIVEEGFTNGSEALNYTLLPSVNKYILIYTRWNAYFSENDSVVIKIGNAIGLIVGKTVAYYSGGEIAYNQSNVIALMEFLYSGHYNMLTFDVMGDSPWSLKQYGDNVKNDVIVLQKKLVTHGYLKMPIDPSTKKQIPFGNFDETTKNAVEQYQKIKRLPVDGVVRKDTWLALSLPWDDKNAQPDRSSWTYWYILSNNNFYMVSPNVTITSPDKGTKAEVGDKIKIAVKAVNCHHIALVIDGKCIVTIYGNFNANAIEFEYDYIIPSAGIHQIEIRGRNVPGSNDGTLVTSTSTVEGIHPEPEVDGKVIGSQEYIDMIDEIYDEKWNKTFLVNSIFFGVISAKVVATVNAASECLKIIMSDVENNKYKLDYISDDNFLRLCVKINSLVQKRGIVDSELHYFRIDLNRVPKTLHELVDENSKLPSDQQWQLMSIEKSLYHMQGEGGLKNLKFVSADGRFEAVYNSDGKLVEDWINIGTYNYAPSLTEGSLKHKIFDVEPYKEWGNHSLSPQKDEKSINEGKELVVDQLDGVVDEIEAYRQNLIDKYGFIEFD
ncbi:MAG: Xyloglucanase Xgh74A precursor [Firmicutes bacterium ADurb.Bin419]|nr:MAG: Xyloglucanase Xgh74A precursor [Firmicutes bacterium ADurb.Bin419]